MSRLAQPLLAAFNLAHFNLNNQLSDLSNEDAIRRARGEEGSSISWIVGHLLEQRVRALNACGVERPNPYAEKFSFQAPATDREGYPPASELKKEWNEIHDLLVEALGSLSDEELLEEGPISSPQGDSSLLAGLSFFQWHEAYHIGVIGLLRLQWGYRHTHELAMEALGFGQ